MLLRQDANIFYFGPTTQNGTQHSIIRPTENLRDNDLKILI